jgi:hypothetical protein
MLLVLSLSLPRVRKLIACLVALSTPLTANLSAAPMFVGKDNTICSKASVFDEQGVSPAVLNVISALAAQAKTTEFKLVSTALISSFIAVRVFAPEAGRISIASLLSIPPNVSPLSIDLGTIWLAVENVLGRLKFHQKPLVFVWENRRLTSSSSREPIEEEKTLERKLEWLLKTTPVAASQVKFVLWRSGVIEAVKNPLILMSEKGFSVYIRTVKETPDSIEFEMREDVLRYSSNTTLRKILMEEADASDLESSSEEKLGRQSAQVAAIEADFRLAQEYRGAVARAIAPAVEQRPATVQRWLNILDFEGLYEAYIHRSNLESTVYRRDFSRLWYSEEPAGTTAPLGQALQALMLGPRSNHTINGKGRLYLRDLEELPPVVRRELPKGLLTMADPIYARRDQSGQRVEIEWDYDPLYQFWLPVAIVNHETKNITLVRTVLRFIDSQAKPVVEQSGKRAPETILRRLSAPDEAAKSLYEQFGGRYIIFGRTPPQGNIYLHSRKVPESVDLYNSSTRASVYEFNNRGNQPYRAVMGPEDVAESIAFLGDAAPVFLERAAIRYENVTSQTILGSHNKHWSARYLEALGKPYLNPSSDGTLWLIDLQIPKRRDLSSANETNFSVETIFLASLYNSFHISSRFAGRLADLRIEQGTPYYLRIETTLGEIEDDQFGQFIEVESDNDRYTFHVPADKNSRGDLLHKVARQMEGAKPARVYVGRFLKRVEIEESGDHRIVFDSTLNDVKQDVIKRALKEAGSGGQAERRVVVYELNLKPLKKNYLFVLVSNAVIQVPTSIAGPRRNAEVIFELINGKARPVEIRIGTIKSRSAYDPSPRYLQNCSSYPLKISSRPKGSGGPDPFDLKKSPILYFNVPSATNLSAREKIEQGLLSVWEKLVRMIDSPRDWPVYFEASRLLASAA